ncbi:MAG: dTDP-4-dehydrorhamnose reductase [Lachnospiraceae bacterium]|nr:dTDP-4-dehydrorhamnose reductase [Lachnospiraceae bacterium]
MRVLVTGATGQLGSDVVKCLQERGAECLGAGSADFDITDAEATRRFITAYRPDAVINCAAYTNVDGAETDEARCRAINADGAANVAAACAACGSKLLHISTDYVFPGEGEQYYDTDDATGAACVYGRTKYEGELAVQAAMSRYFIIRISWVFGKNGKNFVKTMLRLGAEREEVRVVCDQIGSPTYTGDLALLLADMAATEKYGVYHATNEGVCSWAEFAGEIFRQAGLPARVVPIPTSEYPSAAKRPMNSRMSKECLDRAGFARLPDWRDALVRCLEELRDQKA